MGMICRKRILLLTLVFLVPALASAQSRRSGRQVVRLGEETVEGSVQKPELSVFMGRQNLSANEQLELRESFLPRIVESVEKKPF